MPKVPALSACALAEMGKCLSPCNGSVSPDDYAAVVDRLRESLLAGSDAVVASVSRPDDARWPRRAGSRTPGPGATGWCRSCAARPAPSGSGR